MNKSEQDKTNKQIKKQGKGTHKKKHIQTQKHWQTQKLHKKLETIANKQKTYMIRKRQKEKGKEEMARQSIMIQKTSQNTTEFVFQIWRWIKMFLS